MESIVLHLKLMKGVKEIPLACVVQHHNKVAHIWIRFLCDCQSPNNGWKVEPQVDSGMPRYSLCDAFKINALAYWILSKIVMDTDAYVYVKQEKST